MSETKNIQQEVLIAQKTERLVTGLYLVTDLINAQDPIKSRLRSSALAVLGHVTKVASSETNDIAREYSLSLNEVREVVSLLHVATFSGTVSEMNGRLLVEGFNTLSNALRKRRPTFSGSLLVVEEDSSLTSVENHSVALPPTFVPKEEGVGAVFVEEDVKKEIVIKPMQRGEELKTGEEDIKTFEQRVKKEDPVSSYHFQRGMTERKIPAGIFKARKQSRREQILGLFSAGIDVSIKDISSKIKGCSEKTIQRELNALVFDHVLERIGEKRWSRYVLR